MSLHVLIRKENSKQCTCNHSFLFLLCRVIHVMPGENFKYQNVNVVNQYFLVPNMTLTINNLTNSHTGPSCIKKLTIKWDFCNCSLFSGGYFRTVIMFPILFNPPSADLSIITCKKILRNTGNGCRNSHLILSCFMQLGPGH